MTEIINSCVFYQKNHLSLKLADECLKTLSSSIKWNQETIRMFGKQVLQPRLTALYGDSGKPYTYSGRTMQPLDWTPELIKIKKSVEEHPLCERAFTTVLLNYYRSGSDSMGWHRDNEKELGSNPIIASISLGAPRRFLLRDYRSKTKVAEILLEHGSLLVMSGPCQDLYEHSLPKTAKLKEARINLTFRTIFAD